MNQPTLRRILSPFEANILTLAGRAKHMRDPEWDVHVAQQVGGKITAREVRDILERVEEKVRKHTEANGASPARAQPEHDASDALEAATSSRNGGEAPEDESGAKGSPARVAPPSSAPRSTGPASLGGKWPGGLGKIQREVLDFLEANGPIRRAELPKRLGARKGSVSTSVNGLILKGLVEASAELHDGSPMLTLVPQADRVTPDADPEPEEAELAPAPEDADADPPFEPGSAAEDAEVLREAIGQPTGFSHPQHRDIVVANHPPVTIIRPDGLELRGYYVQVLLRHAEATADPELFDRIEAQLDKIAA